MLAERRANIKTNVREAVGIPQRIVMPTIKALDYGIMLVMSHIVVSPLLTTLLGKQESETEPLAKVTLGR